MSIQIPQSMAEVQVQLMERRNHGEQVTEEEIIKNAVKDSLQALMDEALAGHYDDVKWSDHDLVVYDIMGKQVGKVTPMKDNFIADFKASPDNLILYFDDQVAKIVGGR
jgi:hypothetical protein